MVAYNHFYFVGIVHNNSKTSIYDNNKKISKITLSVKDHYNKDKTNLIPLIAYNDNADKVELLGKNGNILAVSGEVVSKEKFNNVTGVVDINIYFVIADIMPIYRTTRTKIENKNFSELIKEYTLEV